MIFLPLFLIWLRAPMHFCAAARWSLILFTFIIGLSTAVDAASATHRHSSAPLRGGDSPGGTLAGEVRATRGISD